MAGNDGLVELTALTPPRPDAPEHSRVLRSEGSNWIATAAPNRNEQGKITGYQLRVLDRQREHDPLFIQASLRPNEPPLVTYGHATIADPDALLDPKRDVGPNDHMFLDRVPEGFIAPKNIHRRVAVRLNELMGTLAQDSELRIQAATAGYSDFPELLRTSLLEVSL